jgi:hypothetical protein
MLGTLKARADSQWPSARTSKGVLHTTYGINLRVPN